MRRSLLGSPGQHLHTAQCLSINLSSILVLRDYSVCFLCKRQQEWPQSAFLLITGCGNGRHVHDITRKCVKQGRMLGRVNKEMRTPKDMVICAGAFYQEPWERQYRGCPQGGASGSIFKVTGHKEIRFTNQNSTLTLNFKFH